MKCIAIDDEPVALSIISRYCERYGGIELETFSSPREGIDRILECSPDIVFLDIEMNGVSGIELAREIPPSCCIIFTTAYARYAIDGFEVNAVDFLHKPYFYERFEKAMQKAQQRLRMHNLLNMAESAQRRLTLKSDYKNVTVPVDTIMFIESVGNYIKIHSSDGKTVLSKITLGSIHEQLPQGEFIRIHRSFIVPVNRISSFSRTEIVLSPGGKSLPVGKKYAEEVMCLKTRR